ncbi:hypothetical protein PR202_ga18806 [Eleusine coracana subsp. coracana]|uniref:Uncharacterized protein n=1 Tax=Eleusine coracana subsp. coracana TaxID=191504 RepID=A0AAV5CSR9_ELECO|nr:hypothetical protein PR202_ga18806 [Eleusine coracana subsp. coracana]
MYCKCSKKGGGATRFKQHLARHGGNVVSCDRVPPDVRAYYLRQFDRTADKKKERQRKSLRQEEIAVEGNVIHDVDDDNDDELHAALRASREDAEYRRSVSRRGGQYQHGGGSSQSQGGGVFGMLKRSISLKGKGAKQPTMQTRIDMGPWTAKSKAGKTAIGRA